MTKTHGTQWNEERSYFGGDHRTAFQMAALQMSGGRFNPLR